MDHSTTPKEKAKITAGAVAALVIVGWIAILAIAVLATRRTVALVDIVCNRIANA